MGRMLGSTAVRPTPVNPVSAVRPGIRPEHVVESLTNWRISHRMNMGIPYIYQIGKQAE